ncbi:aliphatic sulfonates import ATP-binding protein SsuB [Clostridium homopropionicum DSM 5847]|uniref:Aliphatic sulfonates import ATP-binding protein SsuB n=1 Tax=Clostridium homopropionicum DSM 5847 TaxID=1121318 RepID=A0A0L6Z7N3_9CLOT|nr:ABC transporter ATP-binding protein [Clostridium homopropionicum]KOA18974.1 aliphatic sulfonates import ATP-binding protein SsuB [Clostridium homopropionicum DSM 5847]SFG42962.1 NitT/TauT family transport system ATP-binding protein [Clostridium homopropionicum]
MILEINNLSKTFKGSTYKSLVLEDINFNVDQGDFLCILGPSGCGKSTLLKQIACFDKADSGTILLNNKAVTVPELNRVMVFQEFDQLFPWKTAIENVAFPIRIKDKSISKKESYEIANKYLSMVKLDTYGNYYPHELSGGMKQRVAIARALSINPQILLMDEPFGSLDAQTRTTLQEMIVEIWEKTNITIIFVTHDIHEAILLSTKILVMDKNPGRAKKIIENNLPRPRMPMQPGFSRIYDEVYNLL